ncbi:hypothetical protein [Myceligenerans xiligouense]|uniref:imine reductase family protein n=1 Tax=Myceligenerans xiligouense TaxID=253184 RepID=UPI00319D88C7
MEHRGHQPLQRRHGFLGRGPGRPAPAAPLSTGIKAAGENLGVEIDADEHPVHLSTITMVGATADHIVTAGEALGADGGVTRTATTEGNR